MDRSAPYSTRITLIAVIAVGRIGGMPLRIEQHDQVVLLTLDDPATRNALSGAELFAAFERAVDHINTDLNIRAAILTGAGTAFCSGGNVRDMRDKKGMFGGTPEEIALHYRTGIQRIPRALFRLDAPLIAAVNGPAIGAGCDLACMCDIRLASQDAIFAESFVKVGIIPGDGGAWFLPRAIGYSRAAEMAFTGDRWDAKAALENGLVSHVFPPDRLLPEAFALANRIAVNPPQMVRWTKRLLRESQHASLDSVLDMSANYQGLAHHTADHAEALAAMLEKRAPRFEGR
jgi:enoyl-CoA hydratase/carnithine racemase